MYVYIYIYIYMKYIYIYVYKSFRSYAKTNIKIFWSCPCTSIFSSTLDDPINFNPICYIDIHTGLIHDI